MGFIRWFTVGGFQPAVLRSEERFGPSSSNMLHASPVANR